MDDVRNIAMVMGRDGWIVEDMGGWNTPAERWTVWAAYMAVEPLVMMEVDGRMRRLVYGYRPILAVGR
jgi:hypothetical protein